MGPFASSPTIPPGKLIEVTNNAMDEEMLFEEGLATTINPQKGGIINENFPLEKRRHIQRFKLDQDGMKSVIVSYTTENEEEVRQKLINCGLEPILFRVKLPMRCPRNAEQKEQASQFWPMNNIIAQNLTIPEKFEDHKQILSKVYTSKSIIIVKPGSQEILAEEKCDCDNCEGHFEHKVLEALGKVSQWAIQNDSYLCTGLDVYCYYEPCCMCTMAMVHSRVGRLFFIHPNPKYGGVMSQAFINQCPRINHRFRAFRMMFE